MEKLTVFQTDKGRYSVRPIDWEGIWDKQGRIQESGIHHIAIFEEKEEAEFFAKTKNMEEQGKLLILPCKPGDTVYVKMQYGGYKKGEVRDFSHFISCGFCAVVTSDYFEKQHIPFTEFGKTIFLTEQKAYETIKKIKKEKAE